MSDPLIRDLKIKTGSVKRLLKDHQAYTQEVGEQKLKLDKYIADGAEEWPIKNGRKMLEESEKMAKDSSKRLGQAVIGLRDIVVTVKADAKYSGNNALLAAEDALEEASI